MDAFWALATASDECFISPTGLALLSGAISYTIPSFRRWERGARWIFRNLDTEEFIHCRLSTGPSGYQGIVEYSEVG